ncbi:MAG: SDR family oxidoreductase [Cytophagales bacterium]|nr:SDR family oxidoreductase [Cytophagales bacterium]
MPSILITGGLGNLGSWLTQHFVDKGFNVSVLAKNKRPILSNLAFEYISCDISNLEDCKSQLQGRTFDYIVHVASVNDGFVEGYFTKSLLINTLGTRNLLDIWKDSPIKHFIYFSTFQVYGKYNGSIDEKTSLTPKNDYGNTHLFSEYYLSQFGATNNFPFTTLRLTNSYGCPKDMNSSKWYLVLNDLSKSAIEKKEIVLKSNGLAPRDFIWMGDVCKIVEKLLALPPTKDIFNISGENTWNMLQIAQFVQQAYKETYGVEIPIKTNQEDKSTYPEGLAVSAQKLKKLVNYEAKPHFIEEAKKIFQFLDPK